MKSIYAGMMIGLGGLINLSVGGGLMGAVLFSIGLMAVLSQGLKLFTGMAGDTIGIELWKVLLGNVIGTTVIGIITLSFFPSILPPDLISRVDLSQTFFKAVFCGILMSIAVRGWRRGITWLPIPCVTAFIMSGFSHSIADSYYYVLMMDPKFILPWLVSVVGNLIGCNIPYKRWIKKELSPYM